MQCCFGMYYLSDEKSLEGSAINRKKLRKGVNLGFRENKIVEYQENITNEWH